jgi:hypothetical protein
MGDACRYSCFVQKHPHKLLILNQMRMDALDSNPLLKSPSPVHSPKVHRCHAPNADLLNNAKST